MSTDILATAKRLFMHNHPDAHPDLANAAWETDADVRAFWVAQVEVVLGLREVGA